jgi:ABC-2 type transport system ATP-binding protein
MENALEIRNLRKQYSGFTLNDVSFSLPAGSIMGLIGENGAGKTTTIKLILGMIRRDGGDIRVLGKDPLAQEKQVKQLLGVVLDDCHFHDTLRPADIASILRSMFESWDDALYRQLLKRLGVPESKAIKEMSKGMKTKLSICAALAHRPRLLILDEATSGLDPVMRSEVLDILRDFIQDEERSVLISTHITSDLEKIADYITLLHDGHVVFSETIHALQYGCGILRCGQADFARVDPADIAGHRKGQFGHEILVREKERMQRKYPGLVIDPASIEEIMLFYVRRDAS